MSQLLAGILVIDRGGRSQGAQFNRIAGMEDRGCLIPQRSLPVFEGVQVAVVGGSLAGRGCTIFRVHVRVHRHSRQQIAQGIVDRRVAGVVLHVDTAAAGIRDPLGVQVQDAADVLLGLCIVTLKFPEGRILRA